MRSQFHCEQLADIISFLPSVRTAIVLTRGTVCLVVRLSMYP